MAKIQMSQVIMISIALIIIAIILPIGLAYVGSAGNVNTTFYKNKTAGTFYTLSEVVDPAVITLFTILLPILVVIGIIMYFIPRGTD